MKPFNFNRAGSVAEASQGFKAAAEGRYLAGGQTLIPVLKQRLASPSDRALPASHPLAAVVGSDAKLLGYDLSPETLRPGMSPTSVAA